MSLLDAQMQAFVDQSLSFYPADAVDASVTQQRLWYNALCQGFAAPRAAGLQVSDSHVTGTDGHEVPTRRYSTKAEASLVKIVFMHGGGFVVGGLESHDDICAELVQRTGFDLVAVDYRLAPEHQYPDDINDCLAVVDGLLQAGYQIILVGDSAGGALSACVVNARKSYTGTQLLGQVLIYPALSRGEGTNSMREHAHTPLLTREDMDYYMPIRVGGDTSQIPQADPLYMPMQTTDFAGLPPTHLFPAEIDPLCDDCELYAQALTQAKVPVVNHLAVSKGMVHCYLRARNMSDKAAANFTEICAAITSLGQTK